MCNTEHRDIDAWKQADPVLCMSYPTQLETDDSVHLHMPTMHATLQVPRLIDFDNKRSYFRSRARSPHHEDRGHYGTLRITVRREHVFEDSFHQLRMK